MNRGLQHCRPMTATRELPARAQDGGPRSNLEVLLQMFSDIFQLILDAQRQAPFLKD